MGRHLGVGRTKVDMTCEGCGKIFKKLLVEVVRRSHHFCSKDCFDKNKSDFFHKINYKTGTSTTTKGVRVRLLDKSNKRCDSSGYIGEHVLVAEKALGKPLDKKHPIHHRDKNTHNNARTNLVICENQKYHSLLHRRLRILKAGGNIHTDKICARCKGVFNKNMFYSLHSTYDNLDSICIKCKKEIRVGGY